MYEGTPPEWGIIGFVVISAVGLLAYWVRAARADLTSTQKRFMDAVERASERDAAGHGPGGSGGGPAPRRHRPD